MSVPPSAGSPSKQFGDVTAPVSAAGWTAGWTLAEKSEDLARRYRCAADDAAKLSRGLAAGDLHGRMRAVVDAVWTHLHQLGVSWVGFYMPQPVAVGNFGGAEPITELVLGPSRNTPACSPIGMHGVCGQSFRGTCVRIVDDVRDLGPDYIACDPRDRSEIVLPIVAPGTAVGTGAGGPCIAVLDVDSHATGRFGPVDADGLRGVIRAAGLSSPANTPG
ncbi:MAG: hypothetical protein SGJ11_11645 [Phycisphaerae bacterium]|nr:hypothetical protein [Phycisphaerae bacterium]